MQANSIDFPNFCGSISQAFYTLKYTATLDAKTVAANLNKAWLMVYTSLSTQYASVLHGQRALKSKLYLMKYMLDSFTYI